jgi:hypothetical protein
MINNMVNQQLMMAAICERFSKLRTFAEHCEYDDFDGVHFLNNCKSLNDISDADKSYFINTLFNILNESQLKG